MFITEAKECFRPPPPPPSGCHRPFRHTRSCPFLIVCVVSSEKGRKYPITKCPFDISHTVCEELEGFVLLVKRVTAESPNAVESFICGLNMKATGGSMADQSQFNISEVQWGSSPEGRVFNSDSTKDQ